MGVEWNDHASLALAFGTVGGLAGGIAASGLAEGKLTTAEKAVRGAVHDIARHEARLSTTTPTLFGPDSPDAVADALRGAKATLAEAAPTLAAAKRAMIRNMAIGGAIGFVGAAAASFLLYGSGATRN